MTPWDVAVAQADVTGHLILSTQAPIVKKLRVRGVLPAPTSRPPYGSPSPDAARASTISSPSTRCRSLSRARC